MEWQSIETAPKDGTEIILAIPTGAKQFNQQRYWVHLGWYAPDESRFKWQFYDGVDDELDDRAMINGIQEDAPTHWMPLPEPPQ